jgi:hypothetical protein
MLPAVFATVAPPGSTNIPTTVGALALAVTAVAALAALSARETHRIRMEDLGNRNAVPVGKEEYRQLREQSVHGGASANAAA